MTDVSIPAIEIPVKETETTLQSSQNRQQIDCGDPINELHESARAFLLAQGFIFEGDFYETHEKEVIKFTIPSDNGKKKIKCWLKCCYSERKDGEIGFCITFGAHHTSLPNHVSQTFWPNSSFVLTDEERQTINKRLVEGKKLADKRALNEKKIADEKADWCKEKIKWASRTGSHPYFERKGVYPSDIYYEIRNYHLDGNIQRETVALVPIENHKGETRAIQEIYPTKRIFKAGGDPRDKNTLGYYSGCFHTFGKLENGKPIYIAEGYATAASIFASTNITTLMCVSSSNILNVCKEIKKKCPDSEIIICADNDADTEKKTGMNPGIDYATKAAIELNKKAAKKCKVVIPKFPKGKNTDESGRSYTDFNDLMFVAGKEEVKRQIDENSFIPELTQALDKQKKRNESVSVPQLVISLNENSEVSKLDPVIQSLMNNEVGDAELFNLISKGKYLFDVSEGKSGEFYFWTGTHWKLDREKKRYQDIETVANYYQKAANKKSKDGDKALADLLSKRAFNLKSAKRYKSVFEIVSSKIPFTEEWDYCPGKLPCLNGIVDLKAGELSLHKPEFFIRSICPTNYNPIAQRPLFDKFLNDITLDDGELKSFIKRLLGSALLGLPREEKVYYFYGENGRNGKGSLMQTLESVLGPLAKTFPSEMLLLQRNPPSSSTPRPEKANLQGVRFAIFSEIAEKRQIDASEVKNLSGRDTITCRRLFSNQDIQIRPSHTMIIQTNFKPKASAKDGALWKRNVLVPFKAEFVEDPRKSHQRKIDEGFKEKLLLEREGILAWLVEGCLEYQKFDLAIPKGVQDETANYRNENDAIGRFLSEMCIEAKEFTTSKSKMTKAIKEFCSENKFDLPSRNEISTFLKEKFDEYHTEKGDFWRGVKIVDDREMQFSASS